MAKVRAGHWISYAEPNKRIETASDVSVDDMVVDTPQTLVNVCQSREPDTLCVKKVDFVAFIAHVINCTAQTNKNEKKLAIIVTI